MLFMHRGNIKRLINHTESKIDFLGKLKKVFSHKKGEEIIEEDQVVSTPEAEIIVEPDKQEESKQSAQDEPSSADDNVEDAKIEE